MCTLQLSAIQPLQSAFQLPMAYRDRDVHQTQFTDERLVVALLLAIHSQN